MVSVRILLKKIRENKRLYINYIKADISYSTLRVEPPFVFFLIREEKGRLCLNHAKPLKSLLSWTPGLASLVFSHQTGFPGCEHLFVDKPVVIPKPSQLFGLGLKLYSSNMQHMLNRDLIGFLLSLSRVCQNLTSERNALLTGWFLS